MSEKITHSGVVVRVVGNQVRVRIMQQSACRACHAKSMCMAAESKEKEVDCQMTEPMQVGDKVIVSVERRLGLTAVLLAFILPFVLLLGMVWLLTTHIANEALAGTLALVSLLPYYGVLALFRKRIQKRFDFYASKEAKS